MPDERALNPAPLEQFTTLIAKLAYEGAGGPALAYRFEWYEERS